MNNIDLITVKSPKDPVSEAYKTLRTNIQFSSFDEKVKTIMITSAGSGEGKSITSANLAVVMAQLGNKTILIDCDERKPNIHKIFGLSNMYGLSNLLASDDNFESAIVDSGIDNLKVLTSGVKVPNPSELLGSKKMSKLIDSLKEKYDYIILDTTPILAVTDAQIISKYSDGCLLVISSGEAEKEAVIKSKEALENVNSKILGVVLNKIKVNYKLYYKKYYYCDYEEKRHKRKVKKTKKNALSYS